MKNFGVVNTILIVLLIGMVFAMLITGNNVQDNSKDLEVSKTIQREVAPDKVRVVIAISSLGKEIESAMDENTEINNRITEFFSKDSSYTIETRNFQIRERNKWDSDNEEYINTGYEVYNTIEITTKELSLAGEILSNAVKLGAYRIENLEYSLSKEATQALEIELVEQGVVKAKEDANRLAELMGKKIKSVKNIYTSEAYYPIYNRNYYELSSAKGESMLPVLSPEMQTVTMNVRVVFETK